MRLALASVPLFLSLLPAPARAEEAAAPARAEEAAAPATPPAAPAPSPSSDESLASAVPKPLTVETQHRWYGWQTLIADGVSVGLFASGYALKERSLGLMGLGGYALGGPIVHWSHGRNGRAWASLALRAGLPLLGDELATANEAGAILAGAIGAMVLDAAALTHETVRLPARDAARWAPTAAIARGQAFFGVGGAF